jgi:hypothetical protein
MKQSKNSLCWCNSGKKYKRCHMEQDEKNSVTKADFKEVPQAFDEHGNSIYNGLPFNGRRCDATILQQVLMQKSKKIRPRPSEHFNDKSQLLTSERRQEIIDLSGALVDENPIGRTVMCLQFAILVKYQLSKEGINSTIYEGDVKYTSNSKSFEWEHAWILTESGEIIDCNIDTLDENPDAPDNLKPKNYWGPLSEIPSDRKIISQKEFTDNDEALLEKDDDETKIWKMQLDSSQQ